MCNVHFGRETKPKSKTKMSHHDTGFPQASNQMAGSFHLPTTPGKRGPKKGARAAQTQATSSTTMVSDGNSEGEFSFDLPRSNVFRIIKRVVPDDVALANDSKLAFSKAAVVFIMYLTAT